MARVTEVPPVVAVRTRGGVEPHPLIAGDDGAPVALTFVIVTPAGRLSVIEKFVRFVSVGAKRSIRNLVFWPALIGSTENDLTLPVIPVPIEYTLTFAAAETALVAPGWLVMVTAPGGITFEYVAAVALAGVVTLTVIVHDEFAGIEPPVNVTVVFVFVTTPAPQVVEEDNGTYVRLALGSVGRVSDRLTPV